MAEHSYWSASNFESIMACPGKIVLEQGQPDNTNVYAAEGTAAHLVLTWSLQQDVDAAAFLGRIIHLDVRGRPCEPDQAEYEFEVDDDMATYVQACIDYVRAAAGADGVVMVDQRVNYSSYLRVEQDAAWGTLDVIVFRDDEIIGIDFKYGRGVEVAAERNPQISLYVLGALQAYQGVVGEFSRVRLVISQPRVRRAPAEWDCSVEELEAWAREHAQPAVVAATNAATAPRDGLWEAVFLRPGEKQCQFCKAKASCPALRNEVAVITSLDKVPASPEEFELIAVRPPDEHTPEAWLAALMKKVDLIEDWCKAVRAETERRLLAGASVPGFKVVAGRKGARAWSDTKAVEEYLRKTVRLTVEQAYDLKLISPTSAEKLKKSGAIGDRQWQRLTELITQKDGSPSVAPESDSRPALVITPVIEDFDVITESLA